MNKFKYVIPCLLYTLTHFKTVVDSSKKGYQLLFVFRNVGVWASDNNIMFREDDLNFAGYIENTAKEKIESLFQDMVALEEVWKDF